MGSKSIYSPKSLNCYVSGGNNTWQKHSKIIVFPLGFLWSFLSVAFLSLGIHPEQHNEAEGKLGKDTCFSDEIQCPYEDSCHSLSHLCHGKGMCFPIHPNCYNVWIESFHTTPSLFLLSPWTHPFRFMGLNRECKSNKLDDTGLRQDICFLGSLTVQS